MNPSHIEDRVRQITGHTVQATQPLHGGSIAQVVRVTLDDGNTIVAKVPRRDDDPELTLEAWMLNELQQTETLPVPKVLHAEARLLLLEWIEHDEAAPRRRAQEDAAQLLARLHDVKGEKVGLDRDTLIGSLPQPNTPSSSWIEFFREQRLLQMAQRAQASGNLPSFTMARIEALAAKLADLLDEPEHPSLLHGDLWAGNMLFGKDKLRAVLDPAIYFGHPEIELAFTALFGPFSQVFYDHYAEARGIEPGFFEVRKDIYNLYPLLVHLHLFGRTYLPPIAKILDQHVSR